MDYFISTDAPADSLYVRIMVWVSVAVLVAVLVTFLISIGKTRQARGLKEFRKRYGLLVTLLQFSSIIALVLLFLRYEGIYPFTMRLWVWLLAVITLGIGVYGIMKIRKREGTQVVLPTQRDEYVKYLPQAKAKKR